MMVHEAGSSANDGLRLEGHGDRGLARQQLVRHRHAEMVAPRWILDLPVPSGQRVAHSLGGGLGE